VGGPILTPWANRGGQTIQRPRRMRDELGHRERDQLQRRIIESNENGKLSDEPKWNHNLSSGAVLLKISGMASEMTRAAAYTSISPRAISKMAFHMTDSRAATEVGRAVPSDLEYCGANY